MADSTSSSVLAQSSTHIPTSPPRVYLGMRSNAGAEVLVQTAEGVQYVLPICRKVRDHSNGFEWGYGGSGPAQLALAICCDALDGDTQRASRVYQDFKWAFVAQIIGGNWSLSHAEVMRRIHAIELHQASNYSEAAAGDVARQGFTVDGCGACRTTGWTHSFPCSCACHGTQGGAA